MNVLCMCMIEWMYIYAYVWMTNCMNVSIHVCMNEWMYAYDLSKCLYVNVYKYTS